jgi:TonB-linked SusC/RagA family outer membrane protein
MENTIHSKGRCMSKLQASSPPINRSTLQLIIAMKISLILLAISLHVSAAALSQQITLTVQKAPLREVMQSISKQTGYNFLLKNSLTKDAKPVTLTINKAPLKETLKLIFADQPFTYEIVDKSILIQPKEKRKKIAANLEEQDQQQGIRINGKVYDTKNRPLSGVSIHIKGSATGVITESNGSFKIIVPDDQSILVVTHIGFLSTEFQVKGNYQPVIRLKEMTEKLNQVEIVSTGYQTLPKERATGSFAQVSNELFNREVSTDVLSRLNGIAPSLQFNQKAGVTKLSIRGRSTIFANDEPLIVVDNFPFDGDINSINPNDVENVTFLRDAAAASIWGVRAGNGVIVITTKRGKIARQIQLGFNANFTFTDKPDLFYQSRMSTSDFIDVESKLFNAGKYDADLSNTTNMPPLSPVVEILAQRREGTISQSAADQQINALRGNDIRNDLGKHFYQTGVNQQYAVNLSGGGEKYAYYFSSGYDRNISNQIGNDYNRITLNSNNTFIPVKNLQIEVNLVQTISTSHMNNTVGNINVNTSMDAYPYTKLADANGNPLSIVKDYRYSFASDASKLGLLNWNYAPLLDKDLTSNVIKSNSTRINTSVRYTLLPGLNAELRYQFQRETNDLKVQYDQDSYYTRDLINRYTDLSSGGVDRNIPLGDILSLDKGTLNSHNGRAQVNFNKKFSAHEITALAGFEAREVNTDGNSSRYYGYDPSTGSFANIDFGKSYMQYPIGYSSTIPGMGTINKTVDRFRSYFANAAYTYKNKYTLTGSARRDESNLFGVEANKKGVPLWSTGLLWRIDQEKFYGQNWPELKLRMSYGENGNFDNSVTAFTTSRFVGSSYWVSQPYADLISPPNANLQWEKIKVFNVGLDISNRQRTVTASIDYYKKNSRDLIGIGPINPTTGFSTFKGNIAGINGSGVDLDLKTTNINRSIVWTTNFLLSYETNKVSNYTLKADPSNMLIDASSTLSNGGIFSPIVGKPLFSIYSYKYAGLSSTGDPQGYFNGRVTTNYDDLLTTQPDSLLYNGRATPPFYGSLRNNISYKWLTFSFNISFKFGYYFRRQSISYSGLVSSNIGHGDYELRWQKPGDEAKTDIPAFVYPVNVNRDLFYSRSSALVEKGDNIRLQDLQLSADLKQLFGNRIKINGLQFYVYANNIGLIWRANKQHLDPDYGTFIPPSRSIAFGLKANL